MTVMLSTGPGKRGEQHGQQRQLQPSDWQMKQSPGTMLLLLRHRWCCCTVMCKTECSCNVRSTASICSDTSKRSNAGSSRQASKLHRACFRQKHTLAACMGEHIPEFSITMHSGYMRPLLLCTITRVRRSCPCSNVQAFRMGSQA